MRLVILAQVLLTFFWAAVGGVLGPADAYLSALAGGFSVAAPTAVLVFLLMVVPKSGFAALLLFGELLRLIAVAFLLGLAVRFLGNPHWAFLLTAFGTSVLVPLLLPLLQRVFLRRREHQEIEEILERNAKPRSDL